MLHRSGPAPARRACFALVVGLAWALGWNETAVAQQFVTDDAGVTPSGACQLEGWVSSGSAWLLPACTPLARAEVTLGIGYAQEELGEVVHREVQYLLQAKVQLLPDDPGAAGLAVVGGAGLGPFAQAAGVPVQSAFIYAPLTYTFADRRAQVHVNLGWTHFTDRTTGRVLYGTRVDLAVTEHVTAIGEIFGEGPDLGAQLGFRVAAIPELLAFDATFGEALAGETPSIGFALGVAWTPPAFFTPLRGRATSPSR